MSGKPACLREEGERQETACAHDLCDVSVTGNLQMLPFKTHRFLLFGAPDKDALTLVLSAHTYVFVSCSDIKIEEVVD